MADEEEDYGAYEYVEEEKTDLFSSHNKATSNSLHPLPSGGDVLSGFSTGRNGNERVGGSISTFASSPGSDNRNNAGRNSGIHVSFAQAPMSTGDLSSTGISSAATVITPSGVIVQGGVPSDPGRLAVKVQAQARELAELSLRLARSETYSHLVERRLLEVSPSHPMPVSEHHMGQAVEQLSKLALAAAQTLTGAVTPGKISGLASHVISQTAAQRKKTLDQSEQIRELEKALEKERKKVEDLSQKSKEMKQLLTNKDKDRANAIRRADGLQHKVISLEAEMRLAGLVPTAAPSSGVSDIVPQPSSRSISPHVSGEVEVLNQRVVQLKEEISSLRSSHSAISERLERESRGGDQQRSYIAVLERQLEKTASSPDTAQLLTQNARLQGELEARVRESSSRDAAVRETTLQLREANSAIAGLKTQLADTQTRYATLQQQASRIGPSSVLKSPSTPSRKNTSSAGMVVSSPSLGDISTASHVQRVGFPSTTLPQHALELVSRLEAEKGALLDYIAETRDASAHLVATNEQLLAGKADLEGLLARVRGESDANVRAASLAEAEVARMNKQLIDMQSRIASYDSRIADISRDYASASAQLATRASEVGEMTAVQEELLNTIRTHKRIADDAKRESDALRAKLLEAGRKLDADEATLEHIEGQRDANEQRVRELRAQCDASMARVNSLVEQNDKLMSDLTRAQAEKAGAEARISNFEKRVEALERHKQELENAIRSTEAQNGKTGAELDALLVKDRRVQESEARALKYLRSAALATAAANATTVQPGSQEIRSPGDFFPLSDSDDSDGPADPVALLASFAAQEAALFSDQPQSYHVNGSVGGGSLPGTPSRKTAVGGTHAQNRDDDTSTFKRMQLASVAGSRAVTRAEGALRWATDPSLNAAVPQVATACRQLSGWLRTAGMALSDVSRRTSQELEDRRLQRRMLYEEIHSLRDQLKDTLDNLSSERSRANENEARALSLSRQLDTDVQRLSQRHEDAVTERDMLRSSHERLQKSHSDGQLEIGKLSTKVETLSAQLSGASSAHERSAKLADRLASDLRQAEIERDALHDQLQDVQQQLEEARSHSSILQIERKALGDRVIALEAGTKESQSEVKALNEKVMNAQRDAQLAIQRAEQAQGSVSAECDKVSSLTFTANQLREALNESEQLALRQNELLDQMGTQMRSMGEEKGAMQRSMAGLSVELEGAKTALQSASSEFSQKIDSFVGGLRRVGVDVVVPSTNPSGPNAQLILPTVAAAEAFYIHTEQQNSSVSSFGLHSSSPVYALVQKQRSLLSTLLVAGTAATNRVSALLTELGAKKQEIASMKPRLDAVNEVVSTSQEKQRALSSCEAQIAELRSLLAQTESQLVTAQNECQSLRARLGDQQSELERSNTRVAMLVADSEGYRDSERRAQAAFTEAQSQISALNEEIAGMRREQDNLIQQRARAEASTHREVSRMNDLASDMATVNAHKARAEQALARANESVASLRAEVIELRSQLNASLAKGNEFQSSLAEKEAELLAQRQQVRQMASMHAELEQQVARDMQVLSSETVEAVTVRQQTVDVLAVKSAEIEAMKAEISALRSAQQANSTASALPSSTFSTSYPTRTSNANLFAGSNGSRAPSPVERAQPAASMGSGGSIYTQSPSRYSMQALGAPAPSLYSSLQLSSTSLPSSTIIQRTGGNNNISDLPPLYPSQDSVPIGLGRTMASTSMMQSLVPSSNSNTVTASGSASGGSSSTTTTTAGFQSPGTAKLMQRFQAAQQRFEQFKNSS